MLRRRCLNVCVLVSMAGAVPSVMGQIDPVSGIDFVTVGNAGNAPWTGGGSVTNNRGRVDYEFRIGRLEVTSAEWVDFLNAVYDRSVPAAIPHVVVPFGWGGVATAPLNGGRRYRVPAGSEMLPAGGITWRMAAVYCNWLHNDKSTDPLAFMNGAYDVSTFTGGPTYRDQLTRSPGARFWIPSLDEWMKASHYDPNKVNSDGSTGGWWFYSNGSDERPIYGPPGVVVNGELAQANSNWESFDFPGFDPFAVRLGSYPDVVTPYGLLDAAGGTSEWTEATFSEPDEVYFRARYYEGSPRDRSDFGSDRIIGTGGGQAPTIPLSETGFRIAAAVPSPGTGALLGLLVHMSVKRRR